MVCNCHLVKYFRTRFLLIHLLVVAIIQKVYILIALHFVFWKSFLVGTFICSFKIIAGCKSGHTHARVCVRQLYNAPGCARPLGHWAKVKLPSFNSIKCTLWCVIAIIPFYGFEKGSTFPSVILNINLPVLFSEVLKMVQLYIFTNKMWFISS